MKFSLLASVALATAASAFPTFNNLLVSNKARSSGAVTDTCDVGYATQNGGTTGGSTGEQTTVTTLDALKEAASADGAAIIIVDGAVCLSLSSSANRFFSDHGYQKQ